MQTRCAKIVAAMWAAILIGLCPAAKVRHVESELAFNLLLQLASTTELAKLAQAAVRPSSSKNSLPLVSCPHGRDRAVEPGEAVHRLARRPMAPAGCLPLPTRAARTRTPPRAAASVAPRRILRPAAGRLWLPNRSLPLLNNIPHPSSVPRPSSRIGCVRNPRSAAPVPLPYRSRRASVRRQTLQFRA